MCANINFKHLGLIPDRVLDSPSRAILPDAPFEKRLNTFKEAQKWQPLLFAEGKKLEQKYALRLAELLEEAKQRPDIDPFDICDIEDLYHRHWHCRQSGVLTESADPGDSRRAVFWDQKCGQRIICPFASNLLARRHNKILTPNFEQHLANGGHAYFVTLTTPVVPDGWLANQILKVKHNFTNMTNRKAFERRVAGVFACLDIARSLSGGGGWGVHYHAVILTHKRLAQPQSWIGGLWPHQSRISEVTTAAYAMRCVNYSSQSILTKSAKNGETSILNWPLEAWLEWRHTTKGLRRFTKLGILRVKHKTTPYIFKVVGEVHWVNPTYQILIEEHNSTFDSLNFKEFQQKRRRELMLAG